MVSKKNWVDPFDILALEKHTDTRGTLFEVIRFLDYNIPGTGQLYAFTIEPGHRRGDHYHLKKQEWFTCIYGKTTVLLMSKDGEDEMIKLSAEEPKLVYVAPGTTHTIVNNEKGIAVLISYASKQFDAENPDTHKNVVYEGHKAQAKKLR